MAVIEFINGKNNTLSALNRVLKYITNPAKTEENLKGGHNCEVNTAYNEFFMTKSEYSKLKGRQYIHFTQSFAPYDKVTPEFVKKIADELVQMGTFKGFQVAYAVHTDRDHLHTHFVVNTVNKKTGMDCIGNLKTFKSFHLNQLIRNLFDDFRCHLIIRRKALSKMDILSAF